MLRLDVYTIAALVFAALFYWKNLNTMPFKNKIILFFSAFLNLALLLGTDFVMPLGILGSLTQLIVWVSFFLLYAIPKNESVLQKQEVSIMFWFIIGSFTVLNLLFNYQIYNIEIKHSCALKIFVLDSDLCTLNVFCVINILFLGMLVYAGSTYLKTNHVISLAQRSTYEKPSHIFKEVLFRILYSALFVCGLYPIILGLDLAHTTKVLSLVVSYTYILSGLWMLLLAFTEIDFILKLFKFYFIKTPTKKVLYFFKLKPEAKFDLRVLGLSLLTLCTNFPSIFYIFIVVSFLYDQILFCTAYTYLCILVTFVVSLPNFRTSIINIYEKNVFRLLGWNTLGKNHPLISRNFVVFASQIAGIGVGMVAM